MAGNDEPVWLPEHAGRGRLARDHVETNPVPGRRCQRPDDRGGQRGPAAEMALAAFASFAPGSWENRP